MNVNREKLIATINSKWKIKNCIMCGENHWDMGDQMMTMVGVGDDRSMQLGGQFMPLIPVVCSNCGNTVLVNPLAIGCVDNLGDENE